LTEKQRDDTKVLVKEAAAYLDDLESSGSEFIGTAEALQFIGTAEALLF
jgi:hypothetical protein